jgi:hypothetical protein
VQDIDERWFSLLAICVGETGKASWFLVIKSVTRLCFEPQGLLEIERAGKNADFVFGHEEARLSCGH